MSLPEILGWIKSFWDLTGISPFVPAMMIVLLAFFVLDRFFNRD